MKSNSLKANIWLYLILFTFGIIIFLWFFQVVFINTFYEYSKTYLIKDAAAQIVTDYENIDKNKLDKLSYEHEICIEIVSNSVTIYSSNNLNKGCIINNDQYKNDFYSNNYDNQTYKLINPKFNNKTLIYASKINDEISIFVNSSLQPLDATVLILSKQLIIVSSIVIVLALLVGYFISKRISKPIEKINKKASLLANGKYDFDFDDNSKIREIDELATTLNYAKKELEHADEIRRDLLANVSHDLKTPLTMIKGYAEMIRDLTFNNKEKTEENLNIIIDETDRLNVLVEDILILSKIQSSKELLEIEKFDIIEVIKNIIKRYSIFRETEGYDFVCNMPEKLLIKADKKKMEQVIYNLINNAINYTGKDNKIIINVICDNNIRIEIKDTGKGIEDKDIAHIWDKYYHSEKKHKRNKIGTGLGLSIVKNILENHHFEYGVESIKKKGTSFYFIIK